MDIRDLVTLMRKTDIVFLEWNGTKERWCYATNKPKPYLELRYRYSKNMKPCEEYTDYEKEVHDKLYELISESNLPYFVLQLA